MKSIAKVRSMLIGLVLLVVLSITLALTWLRWESGLLRADWFNKRQGQIESVIASESITPHGQSSESVRLVSDSGLQVSFRVIRERENIAPLPVLLILGGHRTGSHAVELFGEVDGQAIVGVDYPYDGPEKAKVVTAIARAIPLAPQATRDHTPPATLLSHCSCAETCAVNKRVHTCAASLGVPFAASAAARDERITAVMLVHGAADNRLWLEAQVARRTDMKLLHYPLATILHWLAYGPILDTSKHIATVAPRPVLIVGARNDERTPAGQTELLFDAAREPKRLRWTEGQHIQPDRPGTIEELLRIAKEELPFLTQ